RVAGAVLGDDQRRAHQLFAAHVFHDEEVFALERIADAPVEASRRLLDDRGQLLVVVGQVDGVQLAGQLLQAGQIALLDVANQVHAQSSRRRDSYRSHAFSSCAISMRSLAVCALPVDRPGPKTMASQPLRAKTPASVEVGLARGAGSSPCRARTAPAAFTSGASSASAIPPALRVTSISRASSPWPSCDTQVRA